MHEIIRTLVDDGRAYDPWGSGMTTMFAVCDVLSVMGGDIPHSAGYRPAMGLSHDAMIELDEYGEAGEYAQHRDILAGLDPDDFPDHWVEGYTPNLTLDDLEHAAVVLNRYLDLVKLAGKDY